MNPGILQGDLSDFEYLQEFLQFNPITKKYVVLKEISFSQRGLYAKPGQEVSLESAQKLFDCLNSSIEYETNSLSQNLTGVEETFLLSRRRDQEKAVYSKVGELEMYLNSSIYSKLIQRNFIGDLEESFSKVISDFQALYDKDKYQTIGALQYPSFGSRIASRRLLRLALSYHVTENLPESSRIYLDRNELSMVQLASHLDDLSLEARLLTKGSSSVNLTQDIFDNQKFLLDKYDFSTQNREVIKETEDLVLSSSLGGKFDAYILSEKFVSSFIDYQHYQKGLGDSFLSPMFSMFKQAFESHEISKGHFYSLFKNLGFYLPGSVVKEKDSSSFSIIVEPDVKKTSRRGYSYLARRVLDSSSLKKKTSVGELYVLAPENIQTQVGHHMLNWGRDEFFKVWKR